MHAHYFMWYNKDRSSCNYTSSLWKEWKNKDQAELWPPDISTVNLYLTVTLTVWDDQGRQQYPYFTVQTTAVQKDQ